MDFLTNILFTLLFFMLIFALPRWSQRNRRLAVERVFGQMQKARGTRLLAIVHRQEAMGLLGIAQLRYIDLNDAEDVLTAIRSTPKNMPLELILHTPGGLVLPALQIARAIKAHPAKTTVYVPHYAMSGGTLIAMAADEIVLNPHAVLGPIDPQIGGLPAASIAAVVAQKDPNAVEDYTLVLNDVAQKAQMQLERAARELLEGTVSANAAVSLASELSSGRWTHDYPIDADEAAELGLNVSRDFPEDINALMGLFPDRASGQNVKGLNPIDAVLGRLRNNSAAKPAARPTAIAERGALEQLPFTGYEPGPGARSFSYGPWNPNDLMPRGGSGPRRRDD